LVEASVSNAD